MEKFKTVIAIQADNAKDADAKKPALEKLSTQLDAKEIDALAELLKKDPMKKELAKKYLGL
jgi:hypothetical protein